MSAKTGAELQAVLKKASQSVREKAKNAGAPLYYMQNGKRIREDANGDKFILVTERDGQQTEYPVK